MKSKSLSRLGKSKPDPEEKKKKRKKKTARQLLEIKADSLVRDIVLERDQRCVTPAPKNGHSNVRQDGHLISRTKESVRWDLYNNNEQCSFCNGRHEHFFEYYDNWFILNIGEDHRKRLAVDSEKVVKLQLYELEELCNQLELIKEKQLKAKANGFVWKPRFSQTEILSGTWSNA